MNRYALALLVVLLAALTPSRASAQADSAKAAAPAPKMSAAEKHVVAAERRLWDLLVKKDWTTFGSIVDGMTYIDMNGVTPRMKTSDMLESLNGIETKSYDLSDVRTRTVSPSVIILTYKAAIDQTSNGQRVPSPIYMMSVWQKKGAKWVPVAHQETNATDAK
jgi:hypothetical protein